jgi:hypothetical protein
MNDFSHEAIQNNIENIRKQMQLRKQKAFRKAKEDKSKKSESLYEEIKKKKKMFCIFCKWYSNVMPAINRNKQHYSKLKHFENAVKLLRKAVRGTLFKELSEKDSIFNGTDLYKTKIPLEDIEKCVDMHIMALLPEYYPQNKDYLRIHLDEFLLNSYVKNGVKSYFAYWMLNDLKPITPLDEVKDEQLLNSLLEELNWEDKYNLDKNKVIFFINKNHDFLSKLKQNAIKDDKNFKAKAIVEGINKSFLSEKKGFTITPSLFVNPKLMDWIEEHIVNSSWIV